LAQERHSLQTLQRELEELQHEKESSKKYNQEQIKTKENEINRLKKQVASKSVPAISQNELETRLQTMADLLIEKQTQLENLNSEKAALQLQLEMRERDRSFRLQSIAVIDSQNDTDKLISNNNTNNTNTSSFSAFSTRRDILSHNISRVVTYVDTASSQIGRFLRKYPVLRFFIIFYTILLHLWVFWVIFTFVPESHSTLLNRL